MEVLLHGARRRDARRRGLRSAGPPGAAGFALIEDGGTAIVEVAAASGLGLVAEDERDAEAASTHAAPAS